MKHSFIPFIIKLNGHLALLQAMEVAAIPTSSILCLPNSLDSHVTVDKTNTRLERTIRCRLSRADKIVQSFVDNGYLNDEVFP